MYYVYILHSKKDGKLYTGVTADLKLRIKKHNSGFVSATKYRLPLSLIYYESYLFSGDARRRELFLKSGAGKKDLEIQLKDYFTKYKWMK